MFVLNRLIFLIVVMSVFFLNLIFVLNIEKTPKKFITKTNDARDNSTGNSHTNETNFIKKIFKNKLIETLSTVANTTTFAAALNETNLINPHHYSYVINPGYAVCGPNEGENLT